MIVGLVGYSRAGKNTLAGKSPEYTRLAFADNLKEICGEIMAKYTGEKLDFFDDKTKVKYRAALVHCGEMFRAIDSNFWINILFDCLDPHKDYVATDVRYLNEARAIKAHGGQIIYISRPGYYAANDTERRSIAEILGDNIINKVVYNVGTIADLPLLKDII